jgi:hypothetical protein
VAGTSRSGGLGWRLFDLGRISELRAINEHFTTRPDYDSADPVINSIHCCI